LPENLGCPNLLLLDAFPRLRVWLDGGRLLADRVPLALRNAE
jgi:hypothetical protein